MDRIRCLLLPFLLMAGTLFSSCVGGDDNPIDPKLLGTKLQLTYYISITDTDGIVYPNYEQEYQGTLTFRQIWNHNKTAVSYTHATELVNTGRFPGTRFDDTLLLWIEGQRDFSGATTQEAFLTNHYSSLTEYNIQKQLHSETTVAIDDFTDGVISTTTLLLGQERITAGDSSILCDKFLRAREIQYITRSTDELVMTTRDTIYHWFSPDRLLLCRSVMKEETVPVHGIPSVSITTEELTGIKRI